MGPDVSFLPLSLLPTPFHPFVTCDEVDIDVVLVPLVVHYVFLADVALRLLRLSEIPAAAHSAGHDGRRHFGEGRPRGRGRLRSHLSQEKE